MFTMDFYAYWNADQVASLLRAVAGMTNSAGYGVFLSAASLLGLTFATAGAAVRNRGGDMIMWFFAAVLFYLALFVPRVNVTVQDTRMAQAQTIENLPLGVGFTAALSSQLGHWAAELFETALSDADAQKFTRFGAVFPERATAAIAVAGPVTSETREILNPWIERCVVPEILESEAKMAELLAADDLAAAVLASGWTNPARFILRGGAPMHCDKAAEALLEVLRTVEIPAQERLLMSRLGAGEAASSQVVEAALKKAIPEAASLMLGTTQTLSESLTHAVLLTEIPAGLERAAAASELPVSAAVSLAKAQGNLASEVAFRTMSELAAAFLPKLRNLLEFILIAAFPLVMGMLIAFGSAGSAVARMYLTLFLWLALWAPIAAVVNWLLIHVDAHPMNQLADLYGGLTLEAADLIRDQGATSQAMAGYMMLLVPLIAYLIARASDMGAASLASSMMSPASSAAQTQSAQLSMGNVASGNASIGNVSANNASANKSDASAGFVSGSVTRTSSAAGTVVRDGATGEVTSVTAARSDLGITAAGTLTQGQMTASASASALSADTIASASSLSGTFARSESGTSGTLTQSADALTAGVQAASRISAEGQRTASGMESRSGTSLSSAAGMRESFGLETGIGGSAGAGALESSETAMGANTASNMASGLSGISALATGSPRMAAGGGGAAGSSGGTGSPAGTGEMRNRGVFSADGRFSASGSLRTATAASHGDEAALVLTHGASSSSAETRSWETRAQASDEARQSFGTGARMTESQSAASGSSEMLTRSSGASRHTTLMSAERQESRSAFQRAAGARMDTLIAERAIEAFGSPEDALEALRNPALRAAFARDALSDISERTAPMDAAGPTGPGTVSERQAAAESAWKASQTAVTAGNSTSAAARTHEASARGFGELVYAEVRAMPPEKTAGSEPPAAIAENQRALEAGRGAAIAARALWDERDVSAQGVLRTGLAGGSFYDSPAAVFERLQAAGEASPEVQNILEEAGRAGEASPDMLRRLRNVL